MGVENFLKNKKDDLVVVKNYNNSLIGLTTKDWRENTYVSIQILKGDEFLPVVKSNLEEISSWDEVLEVIREIKRYATNIKKNLDRTKDDIETYQREIKKISNLKVYKSSKTSKDLLKEFEYVNKNHDHEDFDRSNLLVIENEIFVPHRCESFFYVTNCDLLKFEKMDIVEVTFGSGHRVQKEHKGKTLKFVVNNFLEHKYTRATKRLALTPLHEDWKRNEIVIVDDYARFEALMVDLFAENRRPFAGWENKKVIISKIGEVTELPRYKNYIDYHEILKMGDPTNIIHTTKDVKKKIAFLKLNISSTEEHLAQIIFEFDKTEKMITAIEKFDYKSIIEKNNAQ
jgi:hypothetical protein